MKKIKREGWEKKIESIDEISQGLLIKQNKNKKKNEKNCNKKNFKLLFQKENTRKKEKQK